MNTDTHSNVVRLSDWRGQSAVVRHRVDERVRAYCSALKLSPKDIGECIAKAWRRLDQGAAEKNAIAAGRYAADLYARPTQGNGPRGGPSAA